MPGVATPDEVRAAIIAELVSGTKPVKIKEMYNVSLPTISRIKQSIAPDVREKMDMERQTTLADLVLTHLETSLESSIRIANMTNDAQWMKLQTADNLNKMYGTMTDKAIRMAETIELTQREIKEEDEANAQEDSVLNQEIL